MTRKSVFSILLTATVALGIGLPAMAEWKQTDFLHTSRSGHTATLLPTGKVIVTGGFNSSYLSSAELYDTNTGTWTTTGELATPRHDHTATLLPSGKVLVAGGYNDVDGYLSVAELYDPSTGLWEAIAGLTTPRALHTATLLRTGQVLVAGGYNNVDGYLSDGEIFDSNGSELWQPIGDLNVARMEHTAALLPGGEVLVAGGYNGDDELRSAELYVPGNPGVWVSIEPLEVARRRHTATVLADGTVLVAGGENNGSSLSSSQLYEYDYEHPENGIWKPTGDLLPERTGHTATLLPSGKVLAVGGKDTDYIWDAMLYDPSTGSWQGTGVDEGRRRRHTATLLPSGMVLVAGGQFDGGYLADVQLFDPNMGGGTWGSTASLNQGRARHTATLLPSGQVLVAAGHSYGSSGACLLSAELFDSSTDDSAWVATSPLNMKRCRHTATLLADQKVLVAGGYNGKGRRSLRSAELYNPETGEWIPSRHLRTARSSHTATLLPSEKVLVAGGANGTAFLSNVELYDPRTGKWELTGELWAPRISHTATLLISGKVLVAGGTNANGYLSTAELYDPRAGTWETTGALAEPRASHTATLLFSGKVLVTGGYNGRTVSSAELYDPSTGTWEMTEELGEQRLHHSATLLPSGKILVTGGEKIIDGTTSYLRTAELYDPRSDAWKTISSLATYRSGHTATVLTSGTVLVAGGENSDSYGNLQSVELYDPAIHLEIRQPGITWASEQIRHGDPLYIEGDDFLGDSEGSSGNTQTSSVNYPLVQLREVESGQTVWLSPVLWSLIENPPPNERLTINNLPPTLNPGSHLLRVITAGVPSESRIVDFECSMAITRQPIDVTAEIGTTAAFTVAAQGGRYFQWKKDGFDIPGANGPTYTTPPITAGDAGTTYQVMVDSGCMSALSDSATLTVEEYEDPTARVLSPSGGELWLLSTPGDSPRTETIAWEMSDNTHICRVEVALFHLEDGTYVEVPGGGLL
ncbi:MAG: hypothetical protein GY856_12485, partial [bacterium]|nr:hypothetical protein [bacterium]